MRRIFFFFLSVCCFCILMLCHQFLYATYSGLLSQYMHFPKFLNIDLVKWRCYQPEENLECLHVCIINHKIVCVTLICSQIQICTNLKKYIIIILSLNYSKNYFEYYFRVTSKYFIVNLHYKPRISAIDCLESSEWCL